MRRQPHWNQFPQASTEAPEFNFTSQSKSSKITKAGMEKNRLNALVASIEEVKRKMTVSSAN
jgi:hypothetical protein